MMGSNMIAEAPEPTRSLTISTGPPDDDLAANLRVDCFDAAEPGGHEPVEKQQPWVVAWPAGGRPASDLYALAGQVSAAGWPVAVINSRGCVGSSGETADLPLSRLAADVAAVIEALGPDPVVVLGHAFGNRVMRAVATMHPHLVRGVVLVAAGGQLPPGNLDDLAIVRDRNTSPADRLAALGRAFFEPGSDPTLWLRSGGPGAARLYASMTYDVDDWQAGGSAPMLIVQGSADRSALPENGHQLHRDHPDRVQLVTIEGAAHALAVERPAEVAHHITSWLRS